MDLLYYSTSSLKNTNYKYWKSVRASKSNKHLKWTHHLNDTKMNVVGYLITLANLQSYEESGGPLKDLSIRVGSMDSLATELKNDGFALEGFKETGYYQVGDVGKYISQNLRNYLFYGNVDTGEDGVVLTLTYSNKEPAAAKSSIADEDDGTLSYYIHKSEPLQEDEKQNLYRYLDAVKRGSNRNKRDAMEHYNKDKPYTHPFFK